MIADTPKPPYYAVIFTSLRTAVEGDYENAAERMIVLAKKQEGFLGVESARLEVGITVSYWKSISAILEWENNSDHLLVQKKGRAEWYESFKVRITKVERDYGVNLKKNVCE